MSEQGQKESMFSAKNIKLLTDPIGKDKPKNSSMFALDKLFFLIS